MQGASKQVELDRLKIVLAQNIAKIDSKADLVGRIDPVRFAAALEQLAQINAFKSKLKPEEYFDAAYLPAPPKPEHPAKQQPPQKKKK
jgi:NitT/TauT family transport system substrate-binding protein